MSESEFEQDFSHLLPALNQQHFLQKSEPSLEAICPALPNNCLVTAQRSNGRYYVHCECSDEVGLVPIDPKDLLCFRFDLSAFLKWVASSALVDGDIREVESGTLWYLGEKTLRGETTKVYFSRISNTKELERLQDELQKGEKPPIIFWLGETPLVGYLPPNIISLPEIISVSKKGFLLSRNQIESVFKKTIATKGGDLVLDKNISIQKEGGKYHLLAQKEKNVFKHKKNIRPQAQNIIQFLHRMRNNDPHAFTLQDLADRLSITNKRTVSTRIAEINDVCDKLNVKRIFHKHANDKWGLNPDLTCFK